MTHTPRSDFVERLWSAGRSRYHDTHPFHARMHAGELDRAELALWVQNRFYYQTRIPLKDALIVAKSPDPDFRKRWQRRIDDQVGRGSDPGGLSLWRRLACAVGVPERTLDDPSAVLPGVRDAADAYVDFVRGASVLEAVAASLTELYAPELMQERYHAWRTHYSWVPEAALEYFHVRPEQARRDAAEALELTLALATTPELEQRAVRALCRKTELLWELLDAIEAVEWSTPRARSA